jgi:RNase H-like domain found in reverse transcriptase/Reverse transcriptase (RNA-dependent DNA polymerase)/Integrase zinc binding domain/Chromo (CHRromatin Organisation MOdifier) domain/Zinc knuckle
MAPHTRSQGPSNERAEGSRSGTNTLRPSPMIEPRIQQLPTDDEEESSSSGGKPEGSSSSSGDERAPPGRTLRDERSAQEAGPGPATYRAYENRAREDERRIRELESQVVALRSAAAAVELPVRRAPTMKIQPPREYDGSSLRRYLEFVEACEREFKANPDHYRGDWEFRKTLYASSYLKGEVGRLWAAYEKELSKTGTPTWEQFKTYLKDLVEDPHNRPVTNVVRLYQASQKPDQKIASFIANLQELRAEEPAERAVPDHVLVGLILARCNEDLREKYRVYPTRTWDLKHLSEILVQLEGPSKGKARDNKSPVYHDSSRRKSTSGPKERFKNKSKRGRDPTSPGKDDERRKRSARECFECGKVGHVAADCFSRKNKEKAAARAAKTSKDKEKGKGRKREQSAEAQAHAAAAPIPTLNLKDLELPMGVYNRETGHWRMEVGVQLVIGGTTVKLKALLDSGCDYTMVSESLARLRGIKTIPNKPAPSVKAIEGHQVPIAGWTNLHLIANGPFGDRVRGGTPALVSSISGYSMILGLSWLGPNDITINPRTGAWWCGIIPKFRGANDITLMSAREFKQELEKAVYAHVLFPSDEEPEMGDRAGIAASASRELSGGLPRCFREYADVFSEVEASSLPDHGPRDHEIETLGKAPPWKPLYASSEKELKVLREYLAENLKKGWIRESISPARAPILFVAKPDGGVRICVDYRGLNAITVKNRYPLPLLNEILERVAGAVIFTKLDLRDAYHRIRIKAGHEWKTAFGTRYGHFEYKVMPFGLANAPATFQAYMNQALSGLIDVICVVYLDDILIFSKSEEEHVKHVKTVLERLRKHKLYAKRTKCEFAVRRLKFLGHIISDKGVEMDPSRVEAIRDWPEPTSKKEILMFTGTTNWHRRFIKRYSHISAPLTDLLKGGYSKEKIQLPPAAKKAFRELKAQFEKPPLLMHLVWDLPIRIETDASGFAIGGILSQKHDAQWHPVAYWSRKLIDAERRYPTPDQELLAIYACFKQWRHYCEGSAHQIEVLSDHQNLQHFMTTTSLSARQARVAEFLTRFDFVIKFRAGKHNPADGLSRRPDYKPDNGDEGIVGMLPTLQSKLRCCSARTEASTESAQAESGRSAAAGAQAESGSSAAATRQVESGRSAATKKPAESGSSAAATRQVESGRSAATKKPAESGSSAAAKNPDDDPTSWSLRGVSGAAKSTGQAVGQSAPVASPSIGFGSAYSFEEDCLQHPEEPRMLRACLVAAAEQGPGLSIVSLIEEAQRSDQSLDKTTYGKIRELRRNNHGDWHQGGDGLWRDGARLFVPGSDQGKKAQEAILQRCHDDPLAGHMGVEKTYELVNREYSWPQMRKDIIKYVKECALCQRAKARRHRPYGELMSLPIPLGPMQSLSMDFITDLPCVEHGRRNVDAILVIVDRFTKMGFYIPTAKDLDAPGLADVVFERVFMRFGLPRDIISDRGSLFTSSFWKTLMQRACTTLRYSTAYHPQTDGQTERLNQVLEQYLRCYINYHMDDWPQWLPMAEFAYNNAPQASTGRSPFYALYGFHPKFDWSAIEDIEKGDSAAGFDRIKHLESMREAIKVKLLHAQASQLKHHNKKHTPKRFREGDWVLLWAKNIKSKRPTKKLDFKYLGPFQITQVISSQAYRLRLPQQYGRLHDVFHVSLLEDYYKRAGEEPPPPQEVEGEKEWEVEDILDEKDSHGERMYLLRWKGYPPCEDTWEPESHLEGAKELLTAFRKRTGRNTGSSETKKRGRGRPRKR